MEESMFGNFESYPNEFYFVCRFLDGYSINVQALSNGPLIPGKKLHFAKTMDAIRTFIPPEMKRLELDRKQKELGDVLEIWTY
jgi:hypothetical protein